MREGLCGGAQCRDASQIAARQNNTKINKLRMSVIERPPARKPIRVERASTSFERAQVRAVVHATGPAWRLRTRGRRHRRFAAMRECHAGRAGLVPTVRELVDRLHCPACLAPFGATSKHCHDFAPRSKVVNPTGTRPPIRQTAWPPPTICLG